jgi:alkylation response protein AidB-like acyl-CoA dehydrogenase
VRTDLGWQVTGQKVWTSLAQYAQRCVLLTRTGTPDSAHRGITALFVDMGSPGITVRPIRTMHGSDEFSEVFFDDVIVPFDRTLGGEGDGWAVAMDLLPYERSTSLWHRAAFLHRRLEEVVDAAPPGSLDPSRLGEVIQNLYAFRARSRGTQYRMAAGEELGPETSIDKVLLATSEQAVFDLVADVLTAEVTVGDDPGSQRWRTEYLYSRAASIYGGSAEIQRNIIARRLLHLGSDR